MIAQIQQSVESRGLLIRAAFHVTPGDQVPPLENGGPTGTLLLIGNAGSAMWAAFTRSAEYNDGQADALDRWSIRLGRRLARQFGGAVLFPFGGPPFHPFLSWAKRGDGSVASPLGLSLHPQYGLWHAYRFGLCLPQRLEGLPVLPEPTDLCQRCADKPCLDACPVEAFSGTEYRHTRCAQFLSQSPDHDCNHRGCHSRRACPVGKTYQYQPDHAQFHMRVFVSRHGCGCASAVDG
ncbi:MAG: hypothetical protein V7629_17690 [Motiliproteus sp.]